MEWLHFSDFHLGSNPGRFKEATDTLVSYIQELLSSSTGHIDAVFFTGDITNSGAEKEFRNFEDIFLTPLRAIAQIREAVFYAVPGNHDVDCDAGMPITWEGIRPRNQSVFFLENGDGQAARRCRHARRQCRRRQSWSTQ